MSTPPPTPPTKSKWGRMGGIIRRASQVSLKRTRSREVIPSAVPALSPPSQPTEASLPTPIAESPAREAEALRQEIVGPSPLAQPPAHEEIRPASPESMAMEPAAAPNGGEDEQATSPTGYTPPPGIDSSAGNPGAFMDDPEALPQSDVVVDPYATAPAPAPTETATDAPPPVIDFSAGNPGAFTDDLDDLPQPAVIADPFASTPNPVSYLAPVPAETESEPKPVEIPALESSTSNFDKRMTESMKDFEFVDHEEAHGDTPMEFVEAVVDNAEVDTTAFAPVAEVAPEVASESAPASAPQEAVDLEHGEAAPYYGGDPPMPIAESVPAPTQPTAAPAPTQEPTAAQPTFGAAVMPQYDEHLLSSGNDIWGGAIHTSTSQPKAHEKGGHDVWATGTIAAAAEAAAGAVVVGGMSYTGRSGQQEEEHKAYTSTSLGRSSSSRNRTPLPHPHPGSKTNNEIHANPSAPVDPSR